jgi:hypothetical protein
MKNGIFRAGGWIKDNWANLLTGVIILVMVQFRVTFYGDMKLSIATNDTSSYYLQANIPLFSWEAFTSRRLPTYPVFFNLFEPKDGYHEPAAISYPAAPGVGTKNKAYQPEYFKIVLVQAVLAIFAWVTFTLVICRHLKTKALRPVAAAAILVFAFSPSLAEWDSVLMTESLSFSLFTLLAATTLELLYRVSREKNHAGILTRGLFVVWALLLPMWAFTRDSNSNTLIIILVFLLAFLIIPVIRRNIPVWWVVGLTVWVGFLAYWYSTTTFAANRWAWGWFDIYNDWVDNFPGRKQYFQQVWGMPIPWTNEWVQTTGSKAYLSFLFNNPGFMVTEFMGRLSDAFSENLQPYFFTGSSVIRKLVLEVGDIFHPMSSVSFFFPLFSGLLITITSIRNSINKNKAWLIFSLWLMAMIYGLYTAAFFGDSAGLIRHTLGAVVYMRCMIWLFPLILAEIVCQKTE